LEYLKLRSASDFIVTIQARIVRQT